MPKPKNKNKKKGQKFETKVQKCINSGALDFDKGDLKTDEHLIECIEEHQKVLMSDFTWKQIKDIKLGDEVISIKETDKKTRGKRVLTTSKVLNKIYKGYKEAIYLATEESSLISTPNHKFLTKEKYGKVKWTEIQNIKSSGFYYYGTSIKNYKQYLKGFLLGFIDSDGYFRNNAFTISQKRCQDTLFWLLRELKIKAKVYRNTDFYISTKISKKILEWFEEFEYNQDEDLIKGYLVGIIVGDGHLGYNRGKKTGHFSIACHKQKACYTKILKCLKFLKVKYNIRGNGGLNLIINCPLEKIPFSGFGWKFNKYKEYFHKDIACLEKVFKYRKFKTNPCMMYDIETESGNFIANGFVVHNCKFTEKQGYRITTKLLDKLWDEALTAQKLPILQIGIEGDEDYRWMLTVHIEREVK